MTSHIIHWSLNLKGSLLLLKPLLMRAYTSYNLITAAPLETCSVTQLLPSVAVMNSESFEANSNWKMSMIWVWYEYDMSLEDEYDMNWSDGGLIHRFHQFHRFHHGSMVDHGHWRLAWNVSSSGPNGGTAGTANLSRSHPLPSTG